MNQEDLSIKDSLVEILKKPYWDRLWTIATAMRHGISVEELYKITCVDPWFLHNLRDLLDIEKDILSAKNISGLSNR